MAFGVEQPLVRDHGRLDLGVARQYRGVDDAESLGGLALGKQEVVDALFAHDARRLLRDGLSQEFGARVRSSLHRPPRRQNIESSDAGGSTLSASTPSP